MLSSPDAVLHAGAVENQHRRWCWAGDEVSLAPSCGSEGCEARSISTACPQARLISGHGPDC